MAEVSASIGVACETWMQDWPLEVADPARLSEFLDHYVREGRDAHRRALAELIAFSLDESFTEKIPSTELLERAAEVFRRDVDLLDYWACWEAESEDHMFAISQWVRSLK